MDVLPDVPTIGEFIPGYEAAGWVGLGAPANTAPEIIAILSLPDHSGLMLASRITLPHFSV